MKLIKIAKKEGMKVEWLPLANRFEIDDFTKNRLMQVYPFFEMELAKMEVWYIANPKKQKKNHYRFIVSWLNRVQVKQVGSKGMQPRDYKKEDQEWKKKMEEAIKTAAPPPDDWRSLMNKLKPKGI